MKRLYLFLYYWIPPLFVMGIIFFLSNRQSFKIADTFTLNFLAFKSLHILEYAVLTFFLIRAFHFSLKYTYSFKTALLISAFVSLGYAISDELHQTFVPTREGTLRDILIDSVGILFMVGYTKKYLLFLRRFKIFS